MVGELHLRRLQRLRALPYMAPFGMAWRCAIGPTTLLSEDGMWLYEFGDFGEATVSYTSAAGGEYFGRADAAHETPNGLARLFLKQFPRIAPVAKGSDWTYAGWQVEVLGLTYPNHLPHAFADWGDPSEREDKDGRWRSIIIGGGGGERVRIPVPLPNPFVASSHRR